MYKKRTNSKNLQQSVPNDDGFTELNDDNNSEISESTYVSEKLIKDLDISRNYINKMANLTYNNMLTADVVDSASVDSQSNNKKTKSSIEDLEPISLKEINILNQQKRRRLDPVYAHSNNGCLACERGFLIDFKDNNDLKQQEFDAMLMKLIKQSVFKLSTDELLKSIKNTYDVCIRPYYQEIDNDPGEWGIDCIRTHFFDHLRDPSLNTRRTLDTLISFSDILADNLLVKDSKNPDMLRVYEGNMRAYTSLQETIRKLYATDPRKSLAYDRRMTVISDMGNPNNGNGNLNNNSKI